MAKPGSRTIKAAKNGRICIPADVREAMGFSKGGRLVLEVRDDAMLLSAPEQAARRARKAVEHLFGKPEASTEAFLAERRRQATLGEDPGDVAS